MTTRNTGSEIITREQLDLIPLPAQTATYQPVSHYQLTTKLLTISQDLLTGFDLISERYEIAREGRQFFGVIQFANSDKELSLAIGFRNSYDKSLTVGLCCGANVYVCSNLAFRGEIVILRKHTLNVWTDLEQRAIALCYKSTHNYKQLIADRTQFQGIALDNDGAYAHLGILYGRGIVSPRQLTVAVNEWRKPTHEAFAPRTGWSLYNAVTESLKSSPPADVMENHTNLHDYFLTLRNGVWATEADHEAKAIEMIDGDIQESIDLN